MIGQETPDTFCSAHQNGKETVTFSVTMPAETLANIRTISYAIGGLSVEQLVEDTLRIFLFIAPADILANQEYGWTWDDCDEQARLAEAKRIARDCGDSWSDFRAEVAKLRPFWASGI